MKFETPKMDINIFSENIVTGASDPIANSQTVNDIKDHLVSNGKVDNANRILTFTFD